MLQELKELLFLIETLNYQDETYLGYLKLMNNQLVYVYLEDTRMNCKALEERADILDLSRSLDTKLAYLTTYDENIDALDNPYNI